MERQRRRPRTSYEEEKPEQKKIAPHEKFLKRTEALCNLIIEKNCCREDAALLIGMNLEELEGHLKKNAWGFKVQIVTAEAKRDVNLLEKILQGDESARWALTRLNPARWSKPIVKEREIEDKTRDRRSYEEALGYDPDEIIDDGLDDFELCDEGEDAEEA